jgi:hypothetical protein
MLTNDRLSDHFRSEKDLQNLIDGKVQESRTLEYKSPEALKNHFEVAKDVSSFANSAGGIIIYGVAESNDHYPQNKVWIDKRNEKGDPKETLENVLLSLIQPRIDRLVVKAIPSENDANNIVLIVDIPESHSAPHMANNRYFKRFNFQSVPMEDDEVRALMGRRVRPDLKVWLKFEPSLLYFDETGLSQPIKLSLAVQNNGKALARFICIFVDFPPELRVFIINNLNNEVNWVKMNIPIQRLSCINNVGVFHPSTIIHWTIAELMVKFPAGVEGPIWTTIYAKDCPEKVGGLRYKIRNSSGAALITEELPDEEHY